MIDGRKSQRCDADILPWPSMRKCHSVFYWNQEVSWNLGSLYTDEILHVIKKQDRFMV